MDAFFYLAGILALLAAACVYFAIAAARWRLTRRALRWMYAFALFAAATYGSYHLAIMRPRPDLPGMIGSVKDWACARVGLKTGVCVPEPPRDL